ncbi:MAG TPA: ATP-binding cassette domain-containing protein [Anaerolineaceae bacterium]|nr:ATP-binding cassette domain-containing protein [Anaerolineaceae bacterium]
MLLLDQVSFAYPHQSAVFAGFTWKVERGDAWTILGPSGCGKSTLLYLLAGLRFPQEGNILVDGQPLRRPRPHTGLIIQDYGLLPWATVRQNAALGQDIRGMYGPDGIHAPLGDSASESVEAWLERLGLNSVADQYPGQISGGQRQRTAIARTLVLRPDILLMDEPFSSLDAPTRESLQALTLELWCERALTLVLVTHSIEEAAVMGRKILLLGAPPNRSATIIDNPHAGDPGFRDSQDYLHLVRELRARLETP